MRDSSTFIEFPYAEMKSSISMMPSPKLMHKRLSLGSNKDEKLIN